MAKINSRTISMPVAKLVEDMELYPRHAVDDANVQSLVYALQSGSQLPPIVADNKSKRIVDGWHRARAYKRVEGPGAVTDVELVIYKDEAAMRFDAVRRNSRHGRKLDSVDRTRSVLMLRDSSFNDEQIGAALNMTIARISKIALRVASVPTGSVGAVPGTETITLKRSVRHLAGTALTNEQAIAHASMPGTSFLLVTRQLLLALKNKLINLEDEHLVAELVLLRKELTKRLK